MEEDVGSLPGSLADLALASSPFNSHPSIHLHIHSSIHACTCPSVRFDLFIEHSLQEGNYVPNEHILGSSVGKSSSLGTFFSPGPAMRNNRHHSVIPSMADATDEFRFAEF